MNTNQLTVRALQLTTLATAMTFSQASSAEATWALAKEADGIKVYVREAEGSPLKEFRGEVELPATPDRIVQVLKDAAAFRKWMPDVVVSDLLKSSDREQFHYLVNSAPWPVSSRDGVYHFTYSRAPEGTAPAITVRVEAVPSYLPAREGKVRVPKAEGQWTLSPTKTGVSVSYQMLAEPGGSIPAWMANQAVVDSPFKTLKGLRSYLQASAPASN